MGNRQGDAQNGQPDTNPMTLEEARAFLGQERLQRAQACWVKVSEILQKYNCVIDAEITIRANGQIVPKIEIVAQ